MGTADKEVQARGKAYDGTDFIVSKKRWRHVVDRHAELENFLDAVLLTITSPDEAYIDPRGTIHLLKAPKRGPSDFLAAIVRKECQETYLVTAYPIGGKRKIRGYRTFKKLPLS